MRVRHNLICLDAKYDEKAETLVLICQFPNNEKRIIYFSKSDFTYQGGPVPHDEMHKTAKLWIGKPWIFEMEDDVKPNNDAEEFAHEQVYMNTIGGKMLDMSQEMISDKRILDRKIEDLLQNEAKKKLKEIGGL